jgi:hypothetical protein
MSKRLESIKSTLLMIDVIDVTLLLLLLILLVLALFRIGRLVVGLLARNLGLGVNLYLSLSSSRNSGLEVNLLLLLEVIINS